MGSKEDIILLILIICILIGGFFLIFILFRAAFKSPKLSTKTEPQKIKERIKFQGGVWGIALGALHLFVALVYSLAFEILPLGIAFILTKALIYIVLGNIIRIKVEHSYHYMLSLFWFIIFLIILDIVLSKNLPFIQRETGTIYLLEIAYALNLYECMKGVKKLKS